MAKKWTVESAKACIIRTGGSIGAKAIRHTSPGMRVLGAIDFLCNHHKYRWVKDSD